MIGIIPAAGKAERMNGLPKMMLPTPQGVLIDILCQRMAEMGNPPILYIGTNGLPYQMLEPTRRSWERLYHAETQTMSETVLLAPRHPGDWIVFGMPDSYFDDSAAFIRLALELKDGADVAVGVFATRPGQHRKLGMVEIAGCEVLHVVDKPAETDLTWAWGVLAWKPKFWQYIQASDPHVGYALPRALAAELDVRAVRMEGGYWDCGTPNEYFDLIRHLTGESVTA